MPSEEKLVFSLVLCRVWDNNLQQTITALKYQNFIRQKNHNLT